MPLQNMQTRPLHNIPNPYSRVVASRDAVLAVSSDGSDGVRVSLEKVEMEGVFGGRDVDVVVSAGFVGLRERGSGTMFRDVLYKN